MFFHLLNVGYFISFHHQVHFYSFSPQLAHFLFYCLPFPILCLQFLFPLPVLYLLSVIIFPSSVPCSPSFHCSPLSLSLSSLPSPYWCFTMLSAITENTHRNREALNTLIITVVESQRAVCLFCLTHLATRHKAAHLDRSFQSRPPLESENQQTAWERSASADICIWCAFWNVLNSLLAAQIRRNLPLLFLPEWIINGSSCLSCVRYMIAVVSRSC